MTFEIACKCIDDIIRTHCTTKESSVNINFFGGEPLIKFNLIREIFDYIEEHYSAYGVSFFASTNGTILTEEMKSWFIEHKERFCLGLSLDGGKKTQDHNRSNSFDLIDIKFFSDNWPKQNFKLTISEDSVSSYANDVKFIHSFGVGINGGNVCVGNYKWDDEQLYYSFAKQLGELVDYYVKNDNYNALFELDLAACSNKPIARKCCGCGTTLSYYETDGNKYPCTFIAPMGFNPTDLKKMLSVDYTDPILFTDNECKNKCYLYNICFTCAAENYLYHKRFDIYNKRNCGLKKIIAIAVAELQARKIIDNPKLYDESKIFHTIEAIKNIKDLYLPEYGKYFADDAENPLKE